MKCLVAFFAVLGVVAAQNGPQPKVTLINKQPPLPTFAPFTGQTSAPILISPTFPPSPAPSNEPLPTPSPSFAPIILSTSAPPSFVIRRPTASPAPLIYRPTSDDKNAQLLSYENEINPDGTYKYGYAIDNGIAAAAEGRLVNLYGNSDELSQVVQGSFTWGYSDGNRVLITYTADQNGYQPQGDAIPTSPPIPPLIAKALAWIERQASERSRLAPIQTATL